MKKEKGKNDEGKRGASHSDFLIIYHRPSFTHLSVISELSTRLEPMPPPAFVGMWREWRKRSTEESCIHRGEDKAKKWQNNPYPSLAMQRNKSPMDCNANVSYLTMSNIGVWEEGSVLFIYGICVHMRTFKLVEQMHGIDPRPLMIH